MTAKPSRRPDTTRFRRRGSRPAMAAITAVNPAPRSGPVEDMTASLSTRGDGQATSGWRSGQLSMRGAPGAPLTHGPPPRRWSALVGADADPARPDPDRHRLGPVGRLPGPQLRRERPDRQRDGRLQGGQAAQEREDEPGG